MIRSLNKFDPSLSEEDEITETNFKEKFISLYVLNTRDIAVSSLKEGLTLNGGLDIQSLFWMAPSIVVNKLLFNNPTYTVEDIIDIFSPNYAGTYLGTEEIYYKEQNKFFESVLPKVLKNLSQEDDAFLSDFISYVTGSSYLPHIDANPHFQITIAFVEEIDNGSLPTATTCFNTLNIPLSAYNNDVETVTNKLETAVKLGKDAGYGMN